MSQVPQLLAAIHALPYDTQAVEHMVHVVGLEPDAVATKLGMPVAQVREHMQVARHARHALALERERCPIVHHDDATWPQVVADRKTRDADILQMLAQGLRAHQVAVRVGVSVNVVHHLMCAAKRRRMAEVQVDRADKAAKAKSKRA